MNAVQWVDYGRYTDSSTHGAERGMDRRRASRDVAPRLLVERDPKHAPWMNDIIARLNELTGLSEDWDSYGASVPSRAAANALLEVLAQTTSPETPRPAIVPSPHGHFQAEWHENGIDLEVEVVSPTHIDVLFSSNRDRWNKVLKSDLTSLVEAIDQLTT